MRKYLYSENGFVEKPLWAPGCWVNVECSDNNDFQFLTQELNVPESFLEDIADADERPRTETEGNWLLTILRIPMQSSNPQIPFITVPSASSPTTTLSSPCAITVRSCCPTSFSTHVARASA